MLEPPASSLFGILTRQFPETLPIDIPVRVEAAVGGPVEGPLGLHVEETVQGGGRRRDTPVHQYQRMTAKVVVKRKRIVRLADRIALSVFSATTALVKDLERRDLIQEDPSVIGNRKDAVRGQRPARTVRQERRTRRFAPTEQGESDAPVRELLPVLLIQRATERTLHLVRRRIPDERDFTVLDALRLPRQFLLDLHLVEREAKIIPVGQIAGLVLRTLEVFLMVVRILHLLLSPADLRLEELREREAGFLGDLVISDDLSEKCLR